MSISTSSMQAMSRGSLAGRHAITPSSTPRSFARPRCRSTRWLAGDEVEQLAHLLAGRGRARRGVRRRRAGVRAARRAPWRARTELGREEQRARGPSRRVRRRRASRRGTRSSSSRNRSGSTVGPLQLAFIRSSSRPRRRATLPRMRKTQVRSWERPSKPASERSTPEPGLLDALLGGGVRADVARAMRSMAGDQARTTAANASWSPARREASSRGSSASTGRL